jgi:predicted permease
MPIANGMRLYGIYEDIRQALRLIASNRTLAIGVFLSLSLGIGASTSVFSLIDSVLFRTLPAPQAHRVVQIASANPASAVDPISYADFDELRQRTSTFEILTTVQDEAATVDTHTGSQPRMTLGMLVGSEFFKLMRLRPAAGRAFRSDEDSVPDRDAVAMISYDVWQRDFGGKADAVGRTVRLNVREFTIVGVMPQSFTGINEGGAVIHSQFVVPRMMAAEFEDPGSQPLTNRNFRNAAVYGRLKPGVTLEQARNEVVRAASQIEQENLATNRGQSMAVYTLTGFRRAQSHDSLATAMIFILLGVLVLGIACVNVGNLMLSATPVRTRETAVRLAMGASPARVVRQFILESCILSGIAAASGLGLAALAARWIGSIEMGSGMLPITLDVQIDARVAFFALFAGLGSGILSGLIPAIRCSHGDLNQLMRSADPRVSGPRTPFRRTLVAGQVAVAALVLVLSGLSLKSFSLRQKSDPGFRVSNILTMAFSPIQSLGYTIPQSHQFYQQLVERVRAMPGVQSATLSHHVPFGVSSLSLNVVIDGYAMPEGQHTISTQSEIVGDDYFQTLGIPILRGRAFDQHDTKEARKVVIINQAMADKYWPGQDAIGKRIEIQGTKTYSVEVVGIARTAKYRSIVERPLPFMYEPLNQTDETFMYLFIETKADPGSFVSAARNAVRDVDPLQPIYDIHTMTEIVRQQALFEIKILAQIAAGAGVVSVLLGVLGLYGMLAYSVSQRRREMGIRIAVGATNGRVFRLIVRDGLKLSAAGIAIGLFLAFSSGSFLSELVTPADPNDPLVYGIVAASLVAVTLLSCYLPARRAAQVDPNVCLRSE